ncbi:MAG: DUF6636 domain-containing protein [Gaiellaceae bacterium]
MHRRLVLALAALALALSSSSPALAIRLPGFRSPSGNIRCLSLPGGPRPDRLLCTIARAIYARRLESRCMDTPIALDWHGFLLDAARRGTVNCSGGILYNPDTQRPRFVTLAYGKRWRQGVFTCWSRVTGVTCRNERGHGLFVARQGWRTW